MADSFRSSDECKLCLPGPVGICFVCPRCGRHQSQTIQASSLLGAGADLVCSNQPECGHRLMQLNLSLQVNGWYQSQQDLPLNEQQYREYRAIDDSSV